MQMLTAKIAPARNHSTSHPVLGSPPAFPRYPCSMRGQHQQGHDADGGFGEAGLAPVS